jgi:hypothetical protein
MKRNKRPKKTGELRKSREMENISRGPTNFVTIFTRGVDAEHGCKTTEFKSTDSDSPFPL